MKDHTSSRCMGTRSVRPGNRRFKSVCYCVAFWQFSELEDTNCTRLSASPTAKRAWIWSPGSSGVWVHRGRNAKSEIT